MKKIFSLLFTFMIMAISSTSYAWIFGEDNSDVLSSMYNDVARYVHIGSDNFGVSFYLDKKTVNVHEYAPPNYIIAFQTAYYHLANSPGKKGTEEHAGYTHGGVKRYKYDYSTRTMYIENHDSNGNPYWKILKPLTEEQEHEMVGGDIRHHERLLTQGEIAFFLAYGISFYDKPLTHASENFINRNISSMIPLLKSNLPALKYTSRDRQLFYGYNHKSNQVEIWQFNYNNQTKKWETSKKHDN